MGVRVGITALVMLLAGVATAQTTSPNVLLVTIDTLRADRVGAYGYARARTPTLDALARGGVVALDAVVQVPQTRPSHASIFTGRNPYEHGLRDNASPPLAAGTPTIASVLKAAGYDTGAFIGAYPVSRASGLQQGFTTFDDPFGQGEDVTTDAAAMERRAGVVVDAALRWLKRPRKAPFFAWVHLFDPHAPYAPPAAYVNKAQPYDGEVAYADAQVGRLIAWLDTAGLRGRTLVVVTSDHGEGLGDHGEDEHLFFIYDTTLRVPLLFSWPGHLAAGARMSGQFRSIDFMPTILELAGRTPPAVTGMSRAALVRTGGRLPDNESYAESLYGQLHFGYAPLRGLRAEGWKFIDAPRAELYRVAEDPAEARNLLELRGPVASAMKTRLATYDPGGSAAPSGAVASDPAALERLAALGYVGGAGFQGGTPSGADPKDRIAEFQAYRRDMLKAMRLYHDRDLPGAIRLLTRLAATTVKEGGRELERRNFNVDFYLGRSLLDVGKPADAIAPLENAVKSAPTSAPAWVYLADAYRAAGRPGEAAQAVERGLAKAPANAELLAIRGRLLLQQGDLGGARAALEAARTRNPREPRVRVDLSGLYRNAGQLEAAAAEAREALRLDPRSPDAMVAHGLALGAAGREAEAASAFRDALKRAPDHADALFFLGSVELRAGRAAEAARLLERLVARAPRYPGAAQALAAARAQVAEADPRRTPPALPVLPAAGAVRLRIIRAADAARVEDAARRARAGEDFAALARQVSEDASAPRGGDLGDVQPQDLAEPLRSAAAALAPGQVSAVVALPAGYALLKRDR
jgi:arylsulfatase A-like enzyme/Tfp pilus assembly protein PilF